MTDEQDPVLKIPVLKITDFGLARFADTPDVRCTSIRFSVFDQPLIPLHLPPPLPAITGTTDYESVHCMPDCRSDTFLLLFFAVNMDVNCYFG